MLEFFIRAVEQDPDDVDALFSLGNAYIAVGNAETALPWLKSALRIQPNSPAIYFTIAKAFKMLKKKPEASVMARKSMQLSNPSDPFWDDIKRLVCELQ
jgi:cytochrome c-type biogenesis protein CcmH/NrfG